MAADLSVGGGDAISACTLSNTFSLWRPRSAGCFNTESNAGSRLPRRHDDQLRRQGLQEMLLQIWERDNRTVLFITHDVEEALFLSDEIHVMASRPGRIVEHLTIDLPRPRDRSIVSEPRFVEMKRYCLDLLHRQAPQAGAMSEAGAASETVPA